MFLCPTESCKEPFIAYYDRIQNTSSGFHFILEKTSIGTPKNKVFHSSIGEISPNFIEIYNQANWAEQYNLLQICGVGYRKALEFLIKDYAIIKNSTKEAVIKKDTLQNVINKFIVDSKIKNISYRATWIGNDETHYIRKWDNKDLTDLKLLIDLTLVFIQAMMIMRN